MLVEQKVNCEEIIIAYYFTGRQGSTWSDWFTRTRGGAGKALGVNNNSLTLASVKIIITTWDIYVHDWKLAPVAKVRKSKDNKNY